MRFQPPETGLTQPSSGAPCSKEYLKEARAQNFADRPGDQLADQVSFGFNCANVGSGGACNERSFVEQACMLAYYRAVDALLLADFQEGTRRMIAYVTVGADDIARAERFYSAFLPALGYGLEAHNGDLSYIPPVQPGQSQVSPDFYVKSPFDGNPALAGNGSMVAFEARSQKQVRDLHAAAVAAGGSDEGQPGFRAAYGPQFFVGYLRDPQGNKIALFSSDPDEPGRDG